MTKNLVMIDVSKGCSVGSNSFEHGWDGNNRSAFTTIGERIVAPTLEVTS